MSKVAWRCFGTNTSEAGKGGTGFGDAVTPVIPEDTLPSLR
jgi:hypothetical protein